MTNLEDFDYELPEERVAAVPAESREESRLLVLDRRSGATEHRRFFDMPELLDSGDLLVMNDARVIPARSWARRETGGEVEILLVRRLAEAEEGEDLWRALLRAGGSLREGERLSMRDSDLEVALRREHGAGSWTIALPEGRSKELLKAGRVPLPPYIRRARKQRGLPPQMPEIDRERYQTVYAECPGAVAAPTAGLHFTPELLEEIRGTGVEVRMLTLMVGPGTFRPVRARQVEEHELEAEFFHLPGPTAGAVENALNEGRRVVATGTTTCRVLEYVVREREWREQSGWTDLFVHPPFEFRAIGALITNFHLPRSSLLMLVSAFAGRKAILRAYREAMEAGYRFYSYGDAMFIK